ncbi:tetratricopeptide repeat protein [Campylobacter majalis]
MKFFKYLAVFPIFLFGFSLSINSGIENQKPYSVIELSDEREFECIEQILAYNTKRYACMLDDDGIVDIQDVDLALMDIRYKKEGDKLFIVVLPKTNSRLFNTSAKLHENEAVSLNKNQKSTKFSILIDPNLSEFDPKTPNGINFSPSFPDMLLPNIGALDFSKTPLEGMDSNDIDIYIGIKKSYDAHMYNKVISDTQTAIQRHQNSIFLGDFLLYRLRAMDKIFDTQNEYEGLQPSNIIDEGKAWMRRFTSDENYPEVLYMLARAYIKEAVLSDAKYMIDILMSEHKSSKFTSLATLEYADQLYKNGRSKEAVKLYEDILYFTDDLDVASRAALSLANSNIEKDSMQEAKKYVNKILDANANYFLNDRLKAMDLASQFLSQNMPDVAAKIYQILTDNSSKRDEHYEAALKNLGISLAKANQVQSAYEALTRYQDEYKYGEYTSEVESAKDALFFELNENNSTKLHEHYQALMSRYERGDIGVKALISELELNNSERKFQETLSYTDIIKDLNQTKGLALLGQAALELSKEAIRKNDCQSVINLIEHYDFNRLELAQFKLFDCYIRTARYKDGLNLASSHIYTNDMLDKTEWLVNLAHAAYLNQDYESSIKASNDALAVGSSTEHADPTPALFYRFYSLLKLDRFSEAMATLNATKDLRGYDFKLIEAYDELARYSFGKNDFANASIYAKKALDLQNGVRINTFTPSLNFIYAASSLKLDNVAQALDEAKYILTLKLKPEERSRALSLISDIYIQLKRNDLAKLHLDECVSSNIKNSYTSLCEAQLGLIQ